MRFAKGMLKHRLRCYSLNEHGINIVTALCKLHLLHALSRSAMWARISHAPAVHVQHPSMQPTLCFPVLCVSELVLQTEKTKLGLN